MNILPLIKTGELTINKYGRPVNKRYLKNSKLTLDRSLITLDNPIYSLSYELDIYFRSLAYLTKEMYLHIVYKNQRLQVFYLY
jgi:hypothetical protein